jgi:hypothetical protein
MVAVTSIEVVLQRCVRALTLSGADWGQSGGDTTRRGNVQMKSARVVI